MSLFVEYVRQFRHFQRNARLYLISNALSGITTGILLLLYNLYLASLGYGADFIGLTLFVVTIGAGIAIFPAGYCIDRFGGKAVLIGANLLIGVTGLGQILFRQPLPLLISGFMAGIGVAFILVVNAPYLSVNSSPEERSYLFSLNIVLGLVTTVVGNVLGGALPIWFRNISWLMAAWPAWLNIIFASQPLPRSYQLSLLFAGVIAIPSLVPLFLLSADRPSRMRRGGSGEDARLVPEGPKSHISTAPTDDEGFSFLRSLFRVISLTMVLRILRSPIFLLSLVQALIGAGAGLFISYFNLYFVQHLHASSALFGLLSGGTVAITALFTLLAPWLASRIGRINSVALTELASLPLLVTLGLTTFLPLAACCYLFRQGLMDMSNGVLQVFSMEAVPQEHRGLANSSYQAAFQVPWALTAPVGGLIIAHLSYTPLFFAAAIFYLLAISVLWGNFGRGREKRFEQTAEPGRAKSENLTRA